MTAAISERRIVFLVGAVQFINESIDFVFAGRVQIDQRATKTRDGLQPQIVQHSARSNLQLE